MADKVTGNHLHYPSNPTQVYDESKIGLKTGPADKPDWRARQGQEQVTSTRMQLGKTPLPVAQFGSHAGGGISGRGTPIEQVTSTRMPLGKTPSSPYDPISKTKPELPLKGK
jgi:hypothetical protein